MWEKMWEKWHEEEQYGVGGEGILEEGDGYKAHKYFLMTGDAYA